MERIDWSIRCRLLKPRHIRGGQKYSQTEMMQKNDAARQGSEARPLMKFDFVFRKELCLGITLRLEAGGKPSIKFPPGDS